MRELEFIPPGEWKVIAKLIRQVGQARVGATVMFNPTHWAVGFEFGPGSIFSLLVGPLALSVGRLHLAARANPIEVEG